MQQNYKIPRGNFRKVINIFNMKYNKIIKLKPRGNCKATCF